MKTTFIFEIFLNRIYFKVLIYQLIRIHFCFFIHKLLIGKFTTCRRGGDCLGRGLYTNVRVSEAAMLRRLICLLAKCRRLNVRRWAYTPSYIIVVPLSALSGISCTRILHVFSLVHTYEWIKLFAIFLDGSSLRITTFPKRLEFLNCVRLVSKTVSIPLQTV